MRKILVDAVHKEETRLVACKDGIVEEFEYQNSAKQSFKGNIYLAKVIRVEPSLQAVFVDYGHSSDGFLPLQEIHHEYYQIPVADKEKLQEAMLQKASEEEMDEDLDFEESSSMHSNFYRDYRIQEVMKVGQVMLVQVKKEGRGNKGSTLTTYISLAGRYCVLKPNAYNAGGVSRKIAESSERQRLKKILHEVKSKAGMPVSIIVRTAGENKTKIEIKRDFNYLMSLWNKIRDYTLASKAPAFIYQESDIIQKAIRDMYGSDVDEFLIEGDAAYERARAFMETLLPKHLNKIKKYEGDMPIFSQYFNIDRQIGALYDHVVQLKSGGYLVINQTEALVAIDVNSGRANKERDIEKTALKINLEAVDEISRQLRLRDLSGLIVLDLIDMDESKNKRLVESRLREALSHDKAKINVTKISSLGMLELSRQRLQPNFWEVNTHICGHCNGRGRVRNLEATVVSILRAISKEVVEEAFDELKVFGSSSIIFHILNHKREELVKLEKNIDGKITFHLDESAGADGFFLERVKASKKAKNEVSLPIEVSHITIDALDTFEEEEAKPKEKKRRWRGSKSLEEPESMPAKSEAESHVDEEEKEMERPKKTARRSYNTKYKRDFKREEEPRPTEVEHSVSHNNAPDTESVEQEMAERRKQHKMFLKEIWKKIIE